MNKNVNENHEYKMKQQWKTLSLMCVVLMAFLTIFLMRAYRRNTENIFKELIYEKLFVSHDVALNKLEKSLQSKDTNVEADDLINVFGEKEENIFHYICDTKGEILGGDVKIFDIKYTVESELRAIRVPEKKIAKINSALADLKVDEPVVFDNLGIRNVYLEASRVNYRDWILVSGYRSKQMEGYKNSLIKSNRMLIITLLICAGLMLAILFYVYLKQQKRVMKGQARYDILSEFSDTVLFEYDCMEKSLVFTPNIATLFNLPEVGIIHPFSEDTSFRMIHPDDVGKVKHLLETIGVEKDEIDGFVIRFKDKDGNYRWVRWKGRLVRGRLGIPQVFLGKISDVQDEMTKEQLLRERAELDGLTGALNRKSIEKKIQQLIKEKDCQGFLFMIDVDDFKQVNDTMGHAMGDQALIHLVELLKDNFRKDDLVGRLGGDEFMVFMTDTDEPEAARKRGLDVLKKLEESESLPKFSVSMGAAAFPYAGKDYESLYLAADHAMYISKKTGKNKLHVDPGNRMKTGKTVE